MPRLKSLQLLIAAVAVGLAAFALAANEAVARSGFNQRIPGYYDHQTTEPAREPEPAPSTNRRQKQERPTDTAADTALDLPVAKKVAAVPEPADPVALRAYRVLEKHCARCHQDGRLERLKPAKNFGNVLRLHDIARDPNLILPGNPDASRLYVQMVKQQMPYDVFQEFSGGPAPSAEELDAVRSWIESLGKQTAAVCRQRARKDDAAIVAAIAEDLRSESEARRNGLRYVTLTHLYNACASDEELKVYRQAVVKLLNSLSRNREVAKLRTIDAERTILKFHLDEVNWTAADWNRIVAAYPYAVRPAGDDAGFVERAAATKLAWIRGDWFAYTASRPPLYHALLKLPETFGDLQSQLGVDVDANIDADRARRAGLRKSLVSINNRLIERHGTPTGVLWSTYDFAGNADRRNLFEYPLGPRGDQAFRHDGGEALFSLPNGFNAYFIRDAAGKRLDKAPIEIVQDRAQRDLRVTNGISCLGCHNQGFRKARDDVRTQALADESLPNATRDRVAGLYATAEEMNRLFDSDVSRFRKALREAGIDPDLDLDGVEIVNALSQRYERDVDLRLAAAEFGVTESVLRQALADAGGEAARIARRLEQGTVPRDMLEARFAELAQRLGNGVQPVTVANENFDRVDVAKVGDVSGGDTGDFDLSLVSDKNSYVAKDLAVFTVRSERDCHLTLINVDNNGQGTVIFPNKFQQDNLLRAGRELRFPAADAKFQFRLNDVGGETVIAVCNANGKDVHGIRHDFATRTFTPLGKYRDFLSRQIVVEAREKVAAGRKARQEGRTDVAGRPLPPGMLLARTAVKFEVRDPSAANPDANKPAN